jgi:hypothetical protein
VSTDDRTVRLSTSADERPTEDLGTTALLVGPESRPSDEAGTGDRAGEDLAPVARYGTPPVLPATVAPAPSTPFSLTSLILGVTSVFFGLTVVAPAAGLVFGILGLRREPAGRTLSIWGIVLNSAMLGLVGLLFAALLAFGLLIPFLAVVTGADNG